MRPAPAPDRPGPAPEPAPTPFRSELSVSWALFAGIALLMVGNGLHGTLVALRGSLEGFGTAVVGVVMAGYYAGFVIGAVGTPMLLGRVGHIRVFAALASVVSASLVLYTLAVHPASWVFIRLATGMCLAGLFVVAESWLNDQATNETRGRLLAAYMVVSMAGLGAGQFLIAAGDPGGFELFVVASVLVSIAVAPMALTGAPGPRLEEVRRLPVRELFHIVPLGVVGCALTGFTYGAIFGLGPVFAAEAGFARTEIASFMAVTIFGGVALQIPLGRLSDRGDRRRVIGLVAFTAAGLALGATFLPTEPAPLVVTMVLLGGMALPLYVLAVAHANDYLKPHQMVGASATLVLAYGAGSVGGPVVTAVVMETTSADGFFWVLAGAHVAIGTYAFYRMTRRVAAPEDERVHVEPLPTRGTPVALGLSEELHPEETESPRPAPPTGAARPRSRLPRGGS